ncbi:MAG: pitrilysin family protein [Rikenellaceae bacterium]
MIKYKKRVLSNGLTVLVHSDNSTPLVAVNTIYKVGAKNEDYNKTGFAHLFEHLMFGGTKEVPDFDIPIQMSSGENNAFTNNDYTNYYIIIPKSNLEVALYLEADRMVNLDINEKSLSVQRRVVEEEYKERYVNRPYGDLWQLLRPMVYTTHPYQWSTIGRDIAHVREACLDDVESFYNRYYTPQNAIIAIAGDIDEEATFALVEKIYGSIKKGEVVEKLDIKEPAQTEQRRKEVERDVPSTMIYIVFHMANRLSRQFSTCDIISDLLSGGTSSRMYQTLIKEKRMFSSVNAYITGDIDEGMFIVTGTLLDETDVAEAEAALFEELEKLKSEPIDDYELEKVKNKFEVNTIFGEINVMNKAMNLCFYELLGDIELINNESAVFRSITKDEISKTAKELFVESNSSVLIYRGIARN